MPRELEIDIWNNVTYYKDMGFDNLWYKQTFFESEMIKYEDYVGNYWEKSIGPFPYIKLEFIDGYVGKVVNSSGWGGAYNDRQPIMSISLRKVNNIDEKALLVHIDDTKTPFLMIESRGFEKIYKLDNLPEIMNTNVGFDKE